jgi:protein ImuB
MFVSERVVCVLLPRFELLVAAGDRSELLRVPAAIAPEPGGVAQIGEASPSAEAFGVHVGMRLGEALARCPRLMLIPGDPAGVADRWEEVLVALESIGASVEPEHPGLCYFDAQGLMRLYGGRLAGVLFAARQAVAAPTRFGVAATRFAALAAAHRARARRPAIVVGGAGEVREFLASQPVSLLRERAELAGLPEPLERLGIGKLGELARLSREAVADRFGSVGLFAHELARGSDRWLRPRVASESLRESVELPDASCGPQLEHALALLIDRLLARRDRRGRTIRAVAMSATLVERGGTWHERISFREALADPVRIRLALTPKLATMPAPADELRLTVECFGPPTTPIRGMFDDAVEVRRARLREAVKQARVAAGADAALRVLAVDPDSRLPERRAVLTPYET